MIDKKEYLMIGKIISKLRIDEFPQFPAVNDFEALKKEFIKASNRNLNL